MRTNICLIGVVAALCLCGCKKKPEPAAETLSPTINATEFRPAFASAGPDVKASVDKVMMDIQSSDYAGAVKELDKLAANSTIDESQKKKVNDLSGQIKQKMASMQAK